MDKVWISALIGALTGGFTSCTSVVLFSMPLWGLLLLYPMMGAAIAGVIYGIWRRLEAPQCETQDALTDIFAHADALVK